MKPLQILLGALTFGALIYFSLLLVWVWPLDKAAGVTNGTLPSWLDCETCRNLPFEARMLMIVAAGGGIGASIHIATSFASYVGNGKFVASWGWWYILRIPIGIGLAVLVYLLLRGGFMSIPSGAGNGTDPQDYVNPFGFAGMAGLTGMFSKQATDKLQEVFDTLFRTNQDARRDDKLEEGAVLAVEIADPKEVAVGTTDHALVLTGRFRSSDVVLIDDEVQRVTLDDEGQTITVPLPDDKLARAGTVKVTVLRGHATRPQRADAVLRVVAA